MPDGNFYADRLITRAQLALVLQGIMVVLNNDATITTQYVGSQSEFTDVRSDYYAFNAIMFCVNKGIIKADFPSGSFSPQENVHAPMLFLCFGILKRCFECFIPFPFTF